MNIVIDQKDIKKHGKTEFDENVVYLREKSDVFLKYGKLVKDYANDNGSMISLLEMSYIIDKDEETGKPCDFYILKVAGGLNGPGKWTDYMADIKNLVDRLTSESGHEVWIVKLDNDCLVDIFYIDLCIR